MNAVNFQRSAMAPVGMVAAVSMKTTAKRNMARWPGLRATLTRANLAAPKSPCECPKSRTDTSWAPAAAPSAGHSVTPPSMIP